MRTQPRKKKRYQARWVYPKFIINLQSEIWKVSEVHHGALLKKPFFIYIGYFPPSHFIYIERRRVDHHQQYGCLTVTHQPQVLLGVHHPLFWAPTEEDPSPLWSRFRGSASKSPGKLYSSNDLSVSKCPKIGDAQLKLIEIDLKLTSLLVDVAWRSHKRNSRDNHKWWRASRLAIRHNLI